MSRDIFVWPQPIRLVEAARFTPSQPLIRELEADEAARARLARALDLVGIERLQARLAVSGWFDGLQIEGRWSARIVQTCGVSLEAFDTELSGDLFVRVVPAGSPHAAVDAGDGDDEPGELVFDLEADDPPDVLESDAADLGAYVIEHLALAIDPFPRKPGAAFEPPTPSAEISPFAKLKAWKGGGDSGEGGAG